MHPGEELLCELFTVYGCELLFSSFFYRGFATTSLWMQILVANGVFVCSTQLPANRKMWVLQQFQAGKNCSRHSLKDKVSLFLLPACVFSDPEVEDIMLCPEYVQSNTKIMRNFTRRNSKKNFSQPIPNMPS